MFLVLCNVYNMVKCKTAISYIFKHINTFTHIMHSIYNHDDKSISTTPCLCTYTNIAMSLGFTEMSYFFLKHCMNKLRGLSCPKSIPSFFASIEADDNAASKLEVASFNFFLNFAISLSFLRNFSAKSCYMSKRFCHAYCLTYRMPSKYLINRKWLVYYHLS